MTEKTSPGYNAEVHENEIAQATMPSADVVDTPVGLQSTEGDEKPFWKNLQFNAVFLVRRWKTSVE